jgi:3-methyladenine DNA glycosylase AlkD
LKEPVPALGVRAPALHACAARLARELKPWPAARRHRLADQLWRCGYHEGGLLVASLYRRFMRECGRCEFELCERWLGRYATTWAHVDALSTWLVAATIRNEPALAPRLLTWARSPNPWLRRAAAVGLLAEAKQGRHWPLIASVARTLAHDPEDLVQKGAGWLLKVAYGKRPQETVMLLTGIDAPRLVKRYAAEKMTARDRQRVLA